MVDFLSIKRMAARQMVGHVGRVMRIKTGGAFVEAQCHIATEPVDIVQNDAAVRSTQTVVRVLTDVKIERGALIVDGDTTWQVVNPPRRMHEALIECDVVRHERRPYEAR